MDFLDSFYDFVFGFELNSLGVMTFIFWAICLFTAVTFCVMLYHWRKYGLGGPILALAESAYVIVSVLLLVLAYLSIN